ncbi:hypothetical protein ABB37_01159 [Leptomonas pyrrhocoris]|uniref:Uncharacterized protein n=1 Tax=Leptomonas pyrrhocoris TaxID=157538 RepID=A0A0M9G8H7_LEPPY|nr:hypothetical protein ABB37_01159 [Leptomonas pyrrhocoris]KPA84639.1 hypothetical protein ABB37_01159 [Leptomonas pyrrhocoris]|eukprot:XP_015663078.1 hypothetical protein ABB37_01159 [Leptomonas pyrrhocoris]
MADEKVPRFLQQTTSQLLHQQEALRKRREMLERESTKPPVMRFGTNSPPRSHSRHGRSPVPLSTSVQSTPPRGDNVHRELHWSRADEESLAERVPMRFSMTFRPAPTPVVAGRPRSATGLLIPPSPSLREVNTLDQVSSVRRKAARDASMPRTVSPHSPAPQRTRAEEHGLAAETNSSSDASMQHNAPVPAQTPVPEKQAPSTTGVESTNACTADSADAEPDAEREVPRAGGRQFLPIPPPFPTASNTAEKKTSNESAESGSDADAAGIVGFSNTFAVPRFTSTTPLARGRHERAAPPAEEREEEEEEGVSTPGRPAVGEFRTPRPVTRMSTSLTPVVRDTATQATSAVIEDADPQNVSADKNHEDEAEEIVSPYNLADDGARDEASPVPTPSQIIASLEASAEKRRGAQATPAMSRDHEEGKQENAESVARKEREKRDDGSASPTNNASASRSMELRTPSPTRGTKVSPTPTSQDLIQSVQASANRRPCGCERPTPSPEHSQHHRRTTPSRPTTSPPPTPVPLSDKPMTEFDSLHHKCCDRPTPVSLSSQPAGGDARVTAAPSASPWPTTENIVSSILAGAQDGQRRAREVADDVHEEDGDVSERFSNEEGVLEQREAGAELLTSPTVPPPSSYPPQEMNEEETTAVETSTSPLSVATHTPSPVPTERQYGESVLASAERRRCGRPTPSEREVSPTHRQPHPRSTTDEAGEGKGTSASPQLSAQHLLDSLDVSLGTGNAREKPAERVTAVGGEEEEGVGRRARDVTSKDNATGNEVSPHRGKRTFSPTPTRQHVMASLQASAEKRTRSTAVAMSKASGDTSLNGSRTTGVSPISNPFQSPVLTPQNVKDSVQKLMGDKQQQTRSDAQAPRRPWGESGPSTSEANGNSSASPVVTAEDVDMSLAALEHDQRRQSRSTRVERDFNRPSPASLSGNGAKSGAAVESETSVSQQAAAPQQPMVESPALSDVAAQSAMFFDCVSVPITPAVPAIETVAATRSTATTVAMVTNVAASTSHVPAQFLALQREISAIEQGRSRTRTPPPLHAYEASTPLPPPASPIGGAKGEEDTPRVEASTELAITSPDDVANDAVAPAEQGRRSSLVLVQPTRGHQALIQHPHKPAPVVPPPTISPVQVPRTPTPPPRPPQIASDQRECLPGSLKKNALPSEESGESPLPRPVSLRSQVALPKQPLPQPTVHHSRSPAPAWRVAAAAERPTASFREGYIHPHQEAEEEQRVAQIRHGHSAVTATAATAVDNDTNSGTQEEDLFDSRNDWMDLVEPLRPHTITVSPQGGAVVYTTHALHDTEEVNKSSSSSSSELDAQKQPTGSPSPLSRKRSRSARTPPISATRAPRTAAAASVRTPASVALTMDDGVSTDGRSSDLLTHTPNAHVSQTPRSSTRGRRSQAEELMAMLPTDVAAEVARMSGAEEEEADAAAERTSATQPSTGSPASRRSGLSEDESTSPQLSTISQRVSQRPPRVHRGRDYYIEYLEGIARSSAKKTRAVAARRMQKAIAMDLETAERPHWHTTDPVGPSSKGAKAAHVAATSPAHRRRGSLSATAPSESPYASSDVMLSPMTPTPVQGGRQGRSVLRVSTRLSTELQQALLRDVAATEDQKGNPRRTAATPPVANKTAKTPAAAASPQRGSRAKADRSSPTASHAPTATKTELAKKAKKAKKAHSNRGKKTVRKFVTAKSLRLVKRRPQSAKKR